MNKVDAPPELVLESVDLISLVRSCKHEKPIEKIQGRKKKYRTLFCPDCGLVLEMEEVK